MLLTPEIVFRNIEPSPAVEAKVREKIDALERVFDRITSCRVVIEEPHRHHHAGNLFHIRIDLTVPGREIVVRRDPPEHHAHEDVYVAVREAFDSARRQVEDYVREKRGQTKAHETPPHGKIARILPDMNCGFIATPDGGEVYFHRNAVVDERMEDLTVGTEVRYVESMGEEGPQASTVRRAGRHHSLGPVTGA